MAQLLDLLSGASRTHSADIAPRDVPPIVPSVIWYGKRVAAGDRHFPRTPVVELGHALDTGESGGVAVLKAMPLLLDDGHSRGKVLQHVGYLLEGEKGDIAKASCLSF